ncbi:MFS transporter [Saccharothrix sp. BKS2]|uniref:MFS transporter n=1 Tax=Saccharothrix sp. BKS2 TaxID=3064400 RepID=UPI0039EBC735
MPVAGDLLSRRAVVITADVVRCGTQALAAVLLLIGAGTLWHLALLQAVAATATAFFGPAAAGLLADVVPEAHRRQANALLNATRNGVVLVAPVVSATLVAAVGAGVAFAVDAVTFLISATALAALKAPDRPVPPRPAVPAALAPLLVLLALGAPVPLLAVAAVPAGVQAALHTVFVETARQTHVPAELVARATSFATVVGLGTAPLGMALAGPAAERVGAGAVLVVGAVAAVVSVPLTLAVRSVRQLPAEPADRPSGPAAGPA